MCTHTIVEELHAEGEFTLEGFDLEPLFFKAGEEVFDLLRLGFGLMISEGLLDHRVGVVGVGLVV